MSLFFIRITIIGVLVGSFIFFIIRTGSWSMLQGMFITRLVISLQASLLSALAWVIILEGGPALLRWLRSAPGRLRDKCRDFWFRFKDGLFTKNADDLAENIREHLRNYRTFLWLSLFCLLGVLVSFVALQFAPDSWYRIPGRLMFVFLASFLPAFWIFLQAQGCLWNISAMHNYMSNQEVIQAIIGTALESGRLVRSCWKNIFPHLLSNI
jgi:hypothetical protein